MKITKDQTKLTEEQLQVAKEYARAKIERYLSTEQIISDEQMVEAVNNAYIVGCCEPPEKIVWLDSPKEFLDRWASVRASVGDSVWASVWAYYDANICSFYGFFSEYFEKNDTVWLQKIAENTTGYYFFKKECWLVRKPTTLDLDENGRLHSITGKAIEWADGYGFHLIHGVRFEEKLWRQVKRKNASFEKILGLENIEQRMAALKLHGAEKMLDKVGGELVDTKEVSGMTYKLFKVSKVFRRPQYALKYQDPSTDRIYVSFVDPEVGAKEDALEAIGWKFNLSSEQYKNIEQHA